MTGNKERNSLMNAEHNETPVTVIGLGPMGQAMARTFLRNGHPTTVWNRTPSRADAVVAEGAVRAETEADAVAASELVVLSLTDYQAMYDILGPMDGTLAGQVIVNLSSDTPQRSRDASAWVSERGGRLVAGGIMVPAPLVGTENSYVFYSGPRDAFDAHEATLRGIGRTDYRGEDPALGQLFYQAQLHVFLSSLSAFLQASALVGAAGVPVRTFGTYAADLFDTISSYLPEGVENIAKGEHPGDLATATMMGATAEHIVAASRDAGIDTGLPEAVLTHYENAVAAGHGRDS